MKLSEQERAANRTAFRAMGPTQKIEYVFAYYKLPLVVALVVLVAVVSVGYRAFTYKEPVLYLAYANVVPPDAVDADLGEGYLASRGVDARHSEVRVYRELYLSNNASTSDHQYAYASKIKVMAAVDARQLDIALMNQEAYDLLSGDQYLADLSDAYGGFELLRSNAVVLQSNQVEVDLGEADALEQVTRTDANALEVTGCALLRGFSGDEPLYLGVIANSPRREEALSYLAYVCGR